MPGFIAYIGAEKMRFPEETRSNLLIESKQTEEIIVERRTIKKFLDDKLFSDSSDLFYVVEGVVLNKLDLIKKYTPKQNWEYCVRYMYYELGETFFNLFRGNSSGLLYDKNKKKCLIWTGHAGGKQVFYTKTNNGVLVGSEMGFIVDTMKINSLPVYLNKTGVYLALTAGFQIENHTIVQNVKKVTAGHYLKIENERIEEIQYHRFACQPDDNMSLEEAIEEVDRLFRQSVKMGFEKDREYGLKHITSLSGGLDCRMTSWVAHDLGYTNQLNITFSQSGHYDFTTAQKIATDLRHDFVFKALDNGNCLYQVDEIARLSYGSAVFFNLSHNKSLIDLLNFQEFGLYHTGQLGDSALGSYYHENRYCREMNITDIAVSQEIIEKVEDYKNIYDYENLEQYSLYNRSFCGMQQGHIPICEYTETYSPFGDVDFLEFCLKIPLKFRFNHKLYFDWVLQKYPKAAKYPWEGTIKIEPRDNEQDLKDKHKYMYLFGKRYYAFSDSEFLPWLKRNIKRRLPWYKPPKYENLIPRAKTMILDDPNHMNPVDYWYNTNLELKKFIDSYCSDINRCMPIPEKCGLSHQELEILEQDMKYLANECFATYDKLNVMTLLSALKLIYG